VLIEIGQLRAATEDSWEQRSAFSQNSSQGPATRQQAGKRSLGERELVNQLRQQQHHTV
jgi:hypothetical protein